MKVQGSKTYTHMNCLPIWPPTRVDECLEKILGVQAVGLECHGVCATIAPQHDFERIAIFQRDVCFPKKRGLGG